MKLLCAALAAAALLAQSPDRPRWKIKYFHDQDDTAISFADLKFVSPRLGIAVGLLVRTGPSPGRPSPVALVTKDGGNSWTQQKLPEAPRTLFALNETLWLVAANDGLYRSSDFGLSWKKTASLRGVVRVHFVDDKRGFAVGLKKSVWRTVDGGQKWTAVPEAAEPKTKAENTVYTHITFIDARRAMITGFSKPPRRAVGQVPEWMDPESAPMQRPNVAIVLETSDGGQTWKPQVASVFGQVAQVATTPRAGLSLVTFGEGFPWSSEVLRVNWTGGANKPVYREKTRAVRDIGLDSTGRGYLVAIERSGSISALPIPGKLHVLESADLEKWSEAEVDYKAIANDAVLAIAPDDSRFIATDTGMLLKFEGR